MEHAQIEIQVLAKVVSDAREDAIRELTDLQLAFIGGGNGEITPY